MASRRYENFDLLIEEEQDGYQARVTACPSNETPSTRFVLPFDETRLENLLLKLDPGRSDMRHGPRDSRDAASRELGGALYSAVFTEDIRDAWTRSLDQVQARDCGLRLRLKLTDAPLLAGLPWELLYSVRTNRYPAQSESTPVIRFLGDRGASKALRVEGPLTILFVICSPTDLPDLDTENEWRAVQQELKPLVDRGVVRLERLPDPATPARLLDRLSDGPVHIVHFVGHGDFDEATQEGVVYFCTNYSTKNPIGADRLGSVLQDVEELKLVVLNACQSARGDSHDVFGGMAQGLVQFSVSAVAAMQFPISDKAASTFSRSLYRAIARGNPVDQAIASARKAILMAYPSEWATPVLYLRSDDGVIFDLPAAGEAQAPAPLAPERTPALPAPPPPGPPGPIPAAPPPSRSPHPLVWLATGLAVVLFAAAVGWAWQGGQLPYVPTPSTSTTATSGTATSGAPRPGPALDLVAGHMVSPAVLDIDASGDWPRNGTVVSASTATLSKGADSQTKADWIFAWDAQNLYFFADVADRTLDALPASGSSRLTFDQLSFLIGTPTTANTLQTGDTGLVIAPVAGTSAARGDVMVPDANHVTMSTRGQATGFLASAGATDHGYRVEGKVPWQALGMMGARAGDRYSITVAVVDADRTGIKEVVRDNERAIGQGTEGSWRSAWKTIRLAA